jgi:hypothetical protein
MPRTGKGKSLNVSSGRARTVGIAATGLALGWFILVANLGAYLGRTDHPELALALPYGRGLAYSALALGLAEGGGRGAAVTTPAARAILTSPTNWRGFAAAALAVPDPALKPQLLAQSLAWTRRDPATLEQDYAARIAAADPVGAARSLDARLRIDGGPTQLWAEIWPQLRDPALQAAVGARLAHRPGWRKRLFATAPTGPEDFATVMTLFASGSPVSPAEAAPLLLRYARGDGASRARGTRLHRSWFAPRGPNGPQP